MYTSLTELGLYKVAIISLAEVIFLYRLGKLGLERTTCEEEELPVLKKKQRYMVYTAILVPSISELITVFRQYF